MDVGKIDFKEIPYQTLDQIFDGNLARFLVRTFVCGGLQTSLLAVPDKEFLDVVLSEFL